MGVAYTESVGFVKPTITVLIIAGLAKFFGFNVPINGSGLEIAVAGWLTRSI